MNKNDIRILCCLQDNKCTNDMESYTIKNIEESTELSNTKIRYTIRSLVMAGYIHEGFKTGNASTYYIAQRGIDKLEELTRRDLSAGFFLE